MWGLIFLALESWAGGLGVLLGLLIPKISLLDFYLRGCGISPFCTCAPPTSLDGCGFFNSVVVRLLFSLISVVPEWCFFYILVVILMWLCEEASHVCLHCHLHWESLILFFKIKKNIFREGKGGRKKGRETLMFERNTDASHTPPTRDLAHNPDVCPDQELNWQPFVFRMTFNLLSHTSQDSWALF